MKMSTTVKTFFRQVLLNLLDGLMSLDSSSAAEEHSKKKTKKKRLSRNSLWMRASTVRHRGVFLPQRRSHLARGFRWAPRGPGRPQCLRKTQKTGPCPHRPHRRWTVRSREGRIKGARVTRVVTEKQGLCLVHHGWHHNGENVFLRRKLNSQEKCSSIS